MYLTYDLSNFSSHFLSPPPFLILLGKFWKHTQMNIGPEHIVQHSI
jgi:hypothetical protein